MYIHAYYIYINYCNIALTSLVITSLIVLVKKKKNSPIMMKSDIKIMDKLGFYSTFIILL